MDKQPCGFLRGAGTSRPQPLSGIPPRWEGEHLGAELGLTGSSSRAEEAGVARGPGRVARTMLSFAVLALGDAAWACCGIALNSFCVHATSHIYVFKMN